MNTLSYIRGSEEEIEIGGEYYFGQLWDGTGDGEELLESGAIEVEEDLVVVFEIIEADEKIMDTLVKITDIY